MREKGRYFEIPAGDYPAIEQAAVVLKSSTQKETARRFLNFIKEPGTVELLQTYGFSIPKVECPRSHPGASRDRTTQFCFRQITNLSS